MNDFINFIKDMCMLNKEDTNGVGLSKLCTKKQQNETTSPIKRKTKGDVKISDLMRRTNY